MVPARREFLKWSGALGASLVLEAVVDGPPRALAAPAARRGLRPNPWLAIRPDGRVMLLVHRSEMGQGVRTALPMILAEELGADWSSVEVVQAAPGGEVKDMGTSGSDSLASSWRSLRPAAAAAREMLRSAAARAWGLDPSACTVEGGEVRHPASGRRLGFGALAERAAALPVPRDPPLKAPAEFRLLGTRVRRVDGPAIVRGRAVYAGDVRVPGMLFASLLRPPAPGAKLGAWDPAPARAVPGVRHALELPGGIAVVADSSWAAVRGREALGPTWSGGWRGDSADLWESLEGALGREAHTTRSEGDGAAARAAARSWVRSSYRYPFQAHLAAEPLCALADVRRGSCQIWVGTQAPESLQREVAGLLGIERARVRVNVTLLGGGFGRRIARDYALEAVAISRAAGAPVQLLWTREDDVRHDMFQPCALHQLEGALDAAGRPALWIHRAAEFHLSMFGPFRPDDPESWEDAPWGGFDNPYRFPFLEVKYALAESPVATGAWRSVGYPSSVFARECFLDELAHAAGKDPLALRLELLPSPGRQQVGSRAIDNGDRLRRVLAAAAERSGWGRPLPAPGDGRRRGRGIACNAYHRQTMAAQVAEVSVGPEGDLQVHRIVCAVDCGQVVNRLGLEAQVEGGIAWGLSALRTEVRFRGGTAEQDGIEGFPLLRIDSAPAIEVVVVPSDLPPLGLGEQPVPPAIPAVLNAVFAATGKRIRSLPLGERDARLSGAPAPPGGPP
jgi:isoquinoline 1-oxidoreductase beta subunit